MITGTISITGYVGQFVIVVDGTACPYTHATTVGCPFCDSYSLSYRRDDEIDAFLGKIEAEEAKPDKRAYGYERPDHRRHHAAPTRRRSPPAYRRACY